VVVVVAAPPEDVAEVVVSARSSETGNNLAFQSSPQLSCKLPFFFLAGLASSSSLFRFHAMGVSSKGNLK
jgi:hypothetical protein